MKRHALRIILFSCLIAGSCAGAPFAARAQEVTEPPGCGGTALAPADCYFGRMRMSVLGMRNAIGDLAARVNSASVSDEDAIYGKLVLVNDALADLYRQYPQDTWLPRLELGLARVFAQLPFPAAQIRANDTLDWLIATYPRSVEAFSAGSLRRNRLTPPVRFDIPIEPELPSYAVPLP